MENFSPEMPMELISEVLARLPVKSLVRFRCVCKAWCSLISSSDFAPLHLSCYHNNGDKNGLLGIIWPPHRTSSGCIETCRWILASDKTYEKITQDEYSILYNRAVMDRFDYGYFPCGNSVNGILLLAKVSFDGVDSRVRRELVLWNPMIGKTHKITPYLGGGCPLVGLGYSCSRNDYKVVAITREGNTSVQVYSLSTGRWRNIVAHEESIHHGLSSDGSCLVQGLQGTIFFVSVNFMEQSSHMVLFDVDDEVLKYTELPSELGVEGQWKYPVIYHGKIGLLNISPHIDQCTLWVTGKDQGLGSWTKLYALRFQEVISPSSMRFFKNNGEFMLQNYQGDVGIYDVESGEVKHLIGDFSYMRVYCTPYKESLVLL